MNFFSGPSFAVFFSFHRHICSLDRDPLTIIRSTVLKGNKSLCVCESPFTHFADNQIISVHSKTQVGPVRR